MIVVLFRDCICLLYTKIDSIPDVIECFVDEIMRTVKIVQKYRGTVKHCTIIKYINIKRNIDYIGNRGDCRIIL